LPQRFIVTGGGGFVGQWLTRALLRRGTGVCLVGLGDRPTTTPILTPQECAAVEWRAVDVRDSGGIDALLTASRPDVVVHLAGVSFVPDAERDPALAYAVNVGGAVNVLHSAASLRSRGIADPTVLLVGSGTQYGTHDPSAVPLAESAEMRPVSVYAATKLCQEIAGLQMARARGLRVICTRSFSHSGRGQPSQYLLPSLAARARAAIRDGALGIGNDVVRDYLHVEDVVEAYLSLIEKGQGGHVYNVCSGVGMSVKELAFAALSAAGASARVEPDPALQRPVDMPILVGSAAKLEATTGWRPRYTAHEIIAELVAAS
jgi:GDP-4-dehydro-6-deoxy-D-mannose reductase